MERFGTLFLRVLTVSVGCSVVLAPLLLLAGRLRKKIAARSLYVLFLVLALRLLLPVEIKLPAPAVTVPTPGYTVSVPVPRPEPNVVQVQPALDPVVSPEPSPVPPVRKIPVLHVLGLAWMLGAAGCALCSVGGFLMARFRLLKGSVPANLDLDPLRQELGVRRPVRPVYSSAAPCPLALGLLRPVIVLPADHQQVDDLVLRHELTHIRRWDVAYKLVLSLACWVNWFNPLVWLLDRAAGRNLELCCDDEVTRDLSDAERRRYGDLLLDAAAARTIPFSTCFSGGKIQMKERLSNLFAKKRNSYLLVGLVLVAALLAGGLVACESTVTAGASNPALLEFPGARWNDSPEEVLAGLELSQEQIIGDETNEENTQRVIVAENVPCFGGTASVVLRFLQEQGVSLGLARVELHFSDDTDMDTVKENLTELYGEGSQEKPLQYSIWNNEVVDNTVQSDGTITRSSTTMRLPGQEPFTYLDTPNEHTLYWSASGRNLLQEEFDEDKCAAIFAQRSNPASAEAVAQWLERQALVQITWTDAYVLADRSLKSNKMVTFYGDTYTWLMQRCGSSAPPPDAGGQELSVAMPENEARRALFKDYFYAHYQEDEASVVLADLSGDGLDEMLVLTVTTQDDAFATLSSVTAANFAVGQWLVFGVNDGSVFPIELLLPDSISSSHATGWGYLYLVPHSGENGWAILSFQPASDQGRAKYSYVVYGLNNTCDNWYLLDIIDAFFSLDPDSMMGSDTGDDATLEETQAFLDRVQAYRDSGVPLLVYNETYGSSPLETEFAFLNAPPADAFAGKLDSLSALRGCVASNGGNVTFALPPTPKESYPSNHH